MESNARHRHLAAEPPRFFNEPAYLCPNASVLLAVFAERATVRAKWRSCRCFQAISATRVGRSLPHTSPKSASGRGISAGSSAEGAAWCLGVRLIERHRGGIFTYRSQHWPPAENRRQRVYFQRDGKESDKKGFRPGAFRPAKIQRGCCSLVLLSRLHRPACRGRQPGRDVRSRCAGCWRRDHPERL
jgi:hypothetical protein